MSMRRLASITPKARRYRRQKRLAELSMLTTLDESVAAGAVTPEMAADVLAAYDEANCEPAPAHWPKEDGGQQ